MNGEPTTVRQERYELTRAAKLILCVAATVAIGLLGLHYKGPLVGILTSPATSDANVSAMSRAAPQPTIPGPPGGGSRLEQKRDPVQAKPDRSAQLNSAMQVAWKAAFDEQARRIAEIEKALQSLDAAISAIPKTTVAPVKPKEEAAAASHMIRKNVEETKALRVDVSALPIEFVNSEKSGISSFAKGSVTIGGQSTHVGSKLPSGEILIAVDPESRTVVTDKRIVTVAN